MNEKENRLTPQEIIDINAKRFGVTPEQVTGKSRIRRVFIARAISQLEMREEAGMSYPRIGRVFGAHHTTIISNVRRAKEFKDSEKSSAVSDELPISMIELSMRAKAYLEENFPGISLEDVQEGNRASRIKVPRQALNRYLFYNEGVGIAQITEFLKRDHSTITHAINKPEEKMKAEIGEWQKRVDQRRKKEKVQAAKKEASEKVKQDIDDRKRRTHIFSQTTLKVVTEHYLVDLQNIISKSRLKIFSQPRKTAQYIVFMDAGFSFQKAANLVGRSNHTTARHAIGTVERRMESDPEFRERVEEMQETINKLTDEAMQAEKNIK